MIAHNPILRGFYPDPSVIRVGSDYYLANSTFFWWPGVALHHSKDLVHWEALPSPLCRPSQLDLRGVSAAGGIWAPDLSFHGGKFYLVYTIVHSMYTVMYDTANYLVTADNIEGPWSDPEPLCGFGFDPSLFFAPDGRCFLVSMVTDHRVPKKYAGRIILQEYSLSSHTAVGNPTEIYRGDKIYLEGPHLYWHKGYYYLFAADTGTGEGHGQSVLRSREIRGPYEMYRADFMEHTSENEAWSILTARHDPDFPLQKCGHACLVDTPEGKLYALHLCGRPSAVRNPAVAPRFPGERRYPLGRETAIQEMEWNKEGWPVLKNKTTHPQLNVEVDTGVYVPEDPAGSSLVFYDSFDSPSLDCSWISPAVQQDGRHLSLTAKPGFARLYGREGLASRFDQSMIARRIPELDFTAETCVEFRPENFKQLAGLVLFYDYDNFLYLHITCDEDLGRCIAVLKDENRKVTYPAGFVPLPFDGPVYLRAVSSGFRIQFYCGPDKEHLTALGPEMNATFLSDEACMDGWFTGAVCGIAAQDLAAGNASADFEYFLMSTGGNDERS